MNTICSSAGIVYAEYPRQGVQDLVKAGFENVWVDFAMFCPPDVFEKYEKKYISYKLGEQVIKNPKSMRQVMDPMLRVYQENHLATSMGIAPFLMQDSKRDDLQALLEEVVKESIHICGELGCQYLLVQPIPFGDTVPYYMSLAQVAKEEHVMLLIQNQTKDMNGHAVRGFCSDERSAVAFVDELNQKASLEYGDGEYFGFCMDVGVCNLCGQNMFDFSVALGKRLKAVLLMDNNGHQGASLIPFSCAQAATSQTDWLNLIRGLRKTGFDGELILQIADTALAFSIILRPQVLQLAKATLDYLKWQIELENLLKKYPKRVLFGAGNMCRNYMKCYGEEFPPLFTCDNDAKKWGSEFCGLQIESPEKLKDLASDTAIFICNLYYREIEKQLRDMGVDNPIEFFNDEYLPSFHFDRVEDLIEQKETGGTKEC